MENKSLNHTYQWYAAYTDSRAEKKVFRELTTKGIDCYLPLKIEKKQWSDRIKVVENPLIRGYIFVKVSNREYYDILITQGVRRYVCFEGNPTAIPENQINDLKHFMQCLNTEVEATSEQITKGTFVKIVSGPLCGVSGEVVEIRGKRRIVLRFKDLGLCVHAELGSNKVELIKN
jgi:transcription antitermination factor NusG